MTISPSEWEVMRAVWARPTSSSSQLVAVLEDKCGWSASTTKTLLGRLVDKGYLATSKAGRPFHYEALVRQDQANREQLAGLLGKICQRQHFSLIKTILEDLPMTQDQKDHLSALLDQKTPVDQVPCLCSPGQCACKDCDCGPQATCQSGPVCSCDDCTCDPCTCSQPSSSCCLTKPACQCDDCVCDPCTCGQSSSSCCSTKLSCTCDDCTCNPCTCEK